MWHWLTKPFLRRSPDVAALPPADLGEADRPFWVAELEDLASKSARAQARLSLRLDDLERKLEGGFADLRAAIEAVASSSGSTAASFDWDELLNAMDILEEALRSDETTLAPGVAEGLRGVLARLEGFIAQGSFRRKGEQGAAPDGRLFRVVGTAESPDLPDGAVVRVVRAAVVRGDRVVREGEVLVNRRPA